MLITKLQNIPQAKEQPTEPDVAKFVITECLHEHRGVRVPPKIRTVMNLYDDVTYEFCKDCKEITRILIPQNHD